MSWRRAAVSRDGSWRAITSHDRAGTNFARRSGLSSAIGMPLLATTIDSPASTARRMADESLRRSRWLIVRMVMAGAMLLRLGSIEEQSHDGRLHPQMWMPHSVLDMPAQRP